MAITNREAISKLRKLLQEKDVDSTFTNKILWSVITQNLKWLIRREISAGRIYRSSGIFQTATCLDIIKANKISDCCPIKTNCTIYRTRDVLPNIWENEYGPVILNVTSIDGSTQISIVSIKDYQRKRNNPYGIQGELYGFFDQGYLWFEEKAPKKVNVQAYFSDDITDLYSCDGTCCTTCVRFLDKNFQCPEWVEAELFSKTLEQLYNAKRLPEDNKVDKDPNVKKQ